MPPNGPDIRVESSAPSQIRPAFSVRWSAPMLRKAGIKSVVDFGAGTLRNLPILERHFDEITVVETKKRCASLKPKLDRKNHISLFSNHDFRNGHRSYDALFLVCVLHIVPCPRERLRIVRLAAERIRPGGFIVVDVPQSETYYNRRKAHLLGHNDGYLLKWGRHFTFYKSFYADELDGLFTTAGELPLFAKTWYPKHLIRIWQKRH